MTNRTFPAIVILIAATSAHAHTGPVSGELLGGFLPGFLHPMTGLDHVAAMLAVGLWGAQLGRPALWTLPIAFPLVMAMGGFLGLIGVTLPGYEIGIALSGIALGAAVLFVMRPPLAVALIVVAVFAVFHGYAHGTELPTGADGLVYSIGFVIGTGLLHAAGILIGMGHRTPGGARIVRTLGAVIGGGGVYFLSQALAG